MSLDPFADFDNDIARGLDQLDAGDLHGAMLTFGRVLEAEHFTTVMEMAEAPPAIKEEALKLRYEAKENTSDRGGAFSDFRTWQQMKSKPVDESARAKTVVRPWWQFWK